MIQFLYKKLNNVFALLLVSTLLALSACSSGSGGGSDDSGDPQGNTTKTAAAVASDLESSFEEFQGDELTDFNESQSGVTISTLGFSFCNPDDPLGEPVASSIPPITIYGCTNDVNVDVTPNLGVNSVTVTLEAPHVYIDISGNITGTDFEGYIAITNLMVEVIVGVSANGDGTYDLVSVDSVIVSYDSLTADSNNATINAAINTALATVEENVIIITEDFMTTEIDAFLDSLPPVSL